MKPNTLFAALSAGLFAVSISGTIAQPAKGSEAETTDHAQQPADATGEPVRNTDEWNLPKKGERLAVQGYDPVAYFPEGGDKPTKGSKSITAEHKGVVYRFTTTKNRDLFLAAPDRYEPAFGGWCAWAMRDGDKVEIDPKSYIVRDDRLYLFYDGFLADTRAKWLKTDHAESSQKADTNWNAISGESPRHTAKP